MARSECTKPATVPLPVLPGRGAPRIAPSRNGRRRAWVLAIVQLLIALHIGLWLASRRYGWFGGLTTTPIEPSESMEFVKHGVINAGLIFFALALLSTAILGRWFCGWGCHIVLLQDLCGWMLRKVGIRPSPFRARLIMWVPLLLAVYMFIWPAAYRWGLVPLDAWAAGTLGDDHGLVRAARGTAGLFGVPLGAPPPAWHVSYDLVTTDFWRTFAGVAVAIPFLGICGFATVYFLGNKAFCTYGCPYGGFFAPLDRIAPLRIRVNDDCEQCGHCTAVCTSNVRVHEEVAAYGMVVDPGCMKCLDCVSVCPNDALSVGWGPTAVRAEPRGGRPAPAPRWDLSWPEEIALAAVFAVAFFAFRGLYGLVPMLMAAGIAMCVTWIAWRLWTLARRPSTHLHRWRLRFRGRLTRAGAVFVAAAVVLLLLTVHSTVIRAALWSARRHDDRVQVPLNVALAGAAIDESLLERARIARRRYHLAEPIADGGLGLMAGAWGAEVDLRIAWLDLVLGDGDASIARLREALEAYGPQPGVVNALATILDARGRSDEALDVLQEAVAAGATDAAVIERLVRVGDRAGRADLVHDALARAAAEHPDSTVVLRWLALAELETDRTAEAEATLRRLIAIAPGDPVPHRILATALVQQGRRDEAIDVLESAVEATGDAAVRDDLARLRSGG